MFSFEDFEKFCYCHPHILHTILFQLSASSAASLLAVLGLLEDESWRVTREKLSVFSREIPDVFYTAERIIDKGHFPILIGADLRRLQLKIADPLGYWKNAGSEDEPPIRLGMMTIFNRDTDREESLRAFLESVIFSWQPYGHNENNVNIFAPRNEQGKPCFPVRITLCPLHSCTPGVGDTWVERTDCVGSLFGVDVGQPDSPRRKAVTTSLCYYNFRTGTIAATIPRENLQFRRGALIIHFRCEDANKGSLEGCTVGPDFYPEHAGIGW